MKTPVATAGSKPRRSSATGTSKPMGAACSVTTVRVSAAVRPSAFARSIATRGAIRTTTARTRRPTRAAFHSAPPTSRRKRPPSSPIQKLFAVCTCTVTVTASRPASPANDTMIGMRPARIAASVSSACVRIAVTTTSIVQARGTAPG